MLSKLLELDFKVFTSMLFFGFLAVLGNGIIYLIYNGNIEHIYSYLYVTISYSVLLLMWLLVNIINYFINFYIDEIDIKNKDK